MLTIAFNGLSLSIVNYPIIKKYLEIWIQQKFFAELAFIS